MSYNEPDDALTYDFDSSAEERAEAIRNATIDALIGGYSEVELGDGQFDAPLDEFAQWVCDQAEQDEDEDCREYLYLMVKVAGTHEDLLNMRTDLVTKFMDRRAEL